jgi:hypothetical protein
MTKGGQDVSIRPVDVEIAINTPFCRADLLWLLMYAHLQQSKTVLDDITD